MNSGSTNSQNLSSANDSPIQLDLLAILNRRKWNLVIASLCGLVIGACYYLLWPTKYESTAQIMLMLNNSSAMATNSTGSQNDLSEELLATHIQIVQSPRIVSKALGINQSVQRVVVPVDKKDNFGSSQNEDKAAKGTNPAAPSPEASASPIEPVSPSTDSVESAYQLDATTPVSTTISETVSETVSALPAVATDDGVTGDVKVSQTVDEKIPVPNSAGPSISTVGILEQSESAKSNESGIETVPMSIPTNEPLASPFIGDAQVRGGTQTNSLEAILADLPSIQEHLNDKVTPVKYVLDNLYVTSGGIGKAKKSHSLTIQFRHNDAEDAKTIVSAIVKQYEKFIIEKFQDVNSEAATLIGDARSELEGELTELATKYEKFRSEVPLLASTTTGGNIYQQRYEELAGELSKLQLSYDETQGRFVTIQESLKTLTGSSPAANLEKLSLIDNENAQRLGVLIGVERGEAASAAFMAKQPERMAGAATEYQSLLKAKAQLATMREDFGNNHPEVKALASEIASTEKFLSEKALQLQVTDEDGQLSPDDVMAAYVKMLATDLLTLKKRQSDIENQMKIAESEAKKLVTFELQNETMVRARDHREALYDSVLERLREINLQGASSSMIHEVLTEPEIGEKIEPKGSIAALISILSAGLIGMGLIIVGELRDASIHDPNQLESMLDSKIIAHIPTFSKDKESWPAVSALAAKKPKVDSMLVSHHFPKSKLSEVFRASRIQLSFAVKGDHKSIAFTSANEADGKSTIVANIAVSIAQSGRSVILIDCDLRRPNTFRIFGLESDHHGLSDYVENNESLESLTSPGPVDNLTLLASGHISNNPAETLSSPKFMNLINDLKQKYDYVILDCPPLLPVSDPSIIASIVDSVVFVAKINKYSQPQVKRCLKILTGVGKKVDAIIVNRADEALGSYGYQTYGYEAAASKSYYRA